MKNKYLLCAMAAVMAACSPQVFTMSVDMRHPSSSGLDLSGKSIAVAYLDDLSGRDTVFSAYMANGFAQQLEKDYFGGNTVIDVYRELPEGEDEELEDDIHLDDFKDEIDEWVIEELKKNGWTTARSVLEAPREMLIKNADLEEETVDEVLRILKAEFPDDEEDGNQPPTES